MHRMTVALAASTLLLAAQAWSGDEAPLTLHSAMKDTVAPQAQILWDVSNGAMDDDGNPDPARVDAAKWRQIGEAGLKIKQAALALAAAKHLVAAGPGAKLQDEGPNGANAAKVQGYIDADAATFAIHARELAATADSFIAAAAARDVKKLGEAGGSLDQVCEACHQKFWYPEQSAAK